MRFEQPLTFRPLFMERVWGGRRIEERLGKALPGSEPIGESWELVDRADAQSVVVSGSHAGKTLHALWTEHRAAVFGAVADAPRFPVLAKILDARETLSVQVHPPAAKAAALGGEPKTEMWYLLEVDPGAELYAGFRKGVAVADFDAAVANGTVADILHRIPVKAGDILFLPSGRCHAIGAGCLIVEIQQNSDTTYRVFDWNRVGLDGKPRELHVAASRECIDFDDFEPGLMPAGGVVEAEAFTVDLCDLAEPMTEEGGRGVFYAVVGGRVRCGALEFGRGDFFLLPAEATERTLQPLETGTKLLRTRLR